MILFDLFKICYPIGRDPHLGQKKRGKETVSAVDYLHHDVYAIGLVVFEIVSNGEHLYEGGSDIDTLINMRNNVRINLLSASLDALLRNLIWGLTQSKPEDRITIQQALNHPFFKTKNDHVRALCALNEALIELGKTEEAKKIKEELNVTFFILFQSRWKDSLKFPYVIPAILKKSKYFDSVVSWIRYNRNAMEHAGQHHDILKDAYGRTMADVDLLDEMLKYHPLALVHIYWFSSRFFPELPVYPLLYAFQSPVFRPMKN